MIFNEDNLELSDWQYYVKYEFTLNFVIGDKVFLKSNPEIILEVMDIDNDNVYCEYDNKKIGFSPQVLLHIKYAGLKIYKKTHIICLN